MRAEVRSALEESLADASAEVRSAALVALARLGDREILPRLVAALEDDVHEVRRAAARAIGVLGDPSAVELLEEIVRDDERDGPVRQDAAVALGLLAADAPPAATSDGNLPAPPPPAWTGHEGGVTAVAVAGGVVLSGGADGRVRRHDPSDGAATVLLEADAPIAALSLSPDGEEAAVASSAVTVLSLDGGRPAEVAVDGTPRSVAIEPERGERVAVGHVDGTTTVLRIAGGRVLSDAEGDGAAAAVCRWPTGGEKFAVGGDDGSIRIVFARSGRVLATLTPHTAAVRAIVWSRDEDDLLSAGLDGRIVRWSGRSADDAVPWAEVDQPILSLARSPAGGTVAIGAEDGTVRLLDASGRERGRVDGPGGPVTALAFLADGRRLVAGTAEGRLGPIELGARLVGETPAPASPSAPTNARSLALARLLAPETFFRLDSRARIGVAVGAGVTGDASLAGAVTTLLARKISLSKVVRGHLVSSLAHLGDRTRRDDLLGFLEDDDAHARRAAALGIGAFLEGGDERDVLKRLRERQRREGDVTIRNFLSVSMGRIGGRYGVMPLLQALAEGRRGLFGNHGVANAPRIRMGARSRVSFAALGIGLSRDPAGPEPLTARLEEERELSARAALAVALGLAGDARAAKAIRKALRANRDPVFRSYAALALGMLGDTTERDRLLHDLEHEIDDELILRAALALHVQADHAGERALVDRLEGERRPGARRAVLYALARTGGPAAVEPLLAVLGDRGEVASVRRYAAVALGHVASERYVSRWSAVQALFSYPADPPALLDLLALP